MPGSEEQSHAKACPDPGIQLYTWTQKHALWGQQAWFRSRASLFSVDLLLLDWPQALYRHLFAGNWSANTVWPHSEEAMTQRVARTWVEEDITHSEHYATGLEDTPAGLDAAATQNLLEQFMAQMQATATTVTQLQEEVVALRQGQAATGSGTAPPVGAKTLAGPPPPTRALRGDDVLGCQARGTKRQREKDQAHPASPFMKHLDFMLHVLAGAERRK